MPANRADTVSHVQNGISLPLQAFFATLKQNGFLVTPEQIADANRLILFYAGRVGHEAELCRYLVPLFARDQEEQRRFEDIFRTHFIPRETARVTAARFSLIHHLKRYRLAYGAGAVVLAGLFVLIRFFQASPAAERWQIHLYDRNEYKKQDSGRSAFQVNLNEPLNVSTAVRYDSLVGNRPVRLLTRYSWGDGNPADTISSHVYLAGGRYRLTAYVDVFDQDVFRYRDTLAQQVLVCTWNNSLVIRRIGTQNIAAVENVPDSVRIGESIALRASIPGRQPDTIQWFTIQRTLGDGPTLTTSFQSVGQQTLYCGAIYNNRFSPCNLLRELHIWVYDPKKPKLDISIVRAPDAGPLRSKYTVKPFWWYLSGILSLLFIAVVVLDTKRQRRKAVHNQAAAQQQHQYTALLKSFSGRKLPAELSFQNKNYLAVAEAGINEAAVQMRRRINNEAFYLDIRRTISRAIDNQGYFDPVYSSRLQQSEYLVLIDAGHNNNQQVKLFDYLTEVLRKQNVFIEKYYYRYEPKRCFNALEPAGTSLEKLSEKYGKHILLIFGNAYQLLYDYYPVFNSEYIQLLNRWQYKAVITPVPFPDWGNKETQALLTQLPVVPVDAEGLLVLMEALFTEGYDGMSALKQHHTASYRTASVDFESMEGLEAYCRQAAWAQVTEGDRPVNILFQWIAATAIYPKIRWELTLAIGKALLDRYGKWEELNFTNLLRLARIKWMKDGQFPDYTRLDLLKKLTIENEVAARETVLMLLGEITERDSPQKHLAYEEKEIQRITNEFILYAYDPRKYAVYKTAQPLYEQLWREQRITDAPSRIYLQNEGAAWTTLIGKGAAGSTDRNVSLDEYFRPQDSAAPGKRTYYRQIGRLGELQAIDVTVPSKDHYYQLILNCSGLFLLALLGLILLVVVNYSDTDRFPAFVHKPPLAQYITFNLPAPAVDSGRLTLEVNGMSNRGDSSFWFKLPGTDSPVSVSVRFDDIAVFDTMMRIVYNAYDVKVQLDSGAKQPEKSRLSAQVLVSKDCKVMSALLRNVIRQADSSIQVKESIVPAAPAKQGNSCAYFLVYGSDVSQQKAERLYRLLQSNYVEIELTGADQAPIPLQANEILIYPEGMYAGAKTGLPSTFTNKEQRIIDSIELTRSLRSIQERSGIKNPKKELYEKAEQRILDSIRSVSAQRIQ